MIYLHRKFPKFLSAQSHLGSRNTLKLGLSSDNSSRRETHSIAGASPPDRAGVPLEAAVLPAEPEEGCHDSREQRQSKKTLLSPKFL